MASIARDNVSRGPAKLTGRTLRLSVDGTTGIDAAVSTEIAQCLSAAGAQITTDSEHETAQNRLLVVRRLDREVLSAICRATAFGTVRLVVVVPIGADYDEAAAWGAMEAGASDVVTWDDDDAASCAEGIVERFRRWQELNDWLHAPEIAERLVGTSPAWVAALRELVEAARLADTPVLILGDSGTGKELAARLVHDLDPRPDKRQLVVLDCTTIVPTLSGSEFFGHERGAFTDAVAPRDGAFAEADRGTLFLDELAELPFAMQGELLRVIQDGMYKRVGSNMWRYTRFRLVCATNRDLREQVAKGRFRNDLYHRVAAWTVRLPSLRDRPEDVPALAEHFVSQARPELKAPRLNPAVLGVLRRRDYPGNVRELRQLVTRVAARHVGSGPITPGDLPSDERPREHVRTGDDEPWDAGELERCVRSALTRRASLHEIGRMAEAIAIRVALKESGGNLRRASARLGVTERALQMRRAAARKNDANKPL